jgi:hypothetical protein
LIPSTSIISEERDSPLFNLGIVEVGQHTSIKGNATFNPLMKVTPLKYEINLGLAKFGVGWEGNQLEFGLATPSTDYAVNGSDATVSYRQSSNVTFMYDGWNTTIRGEYNTVDLRVSGSDDYPGFQGNLTQGTYFEEKPVQIAAAQAAVGVIIAAAVFFPEALIALAEAIRQVGTNPIAP